MKQQAIEVTVGERAITPPVRAVQSDSGRELHCVLADFEIPSGTTARFFARKPSGAQIYNNCTVSGNEVVVKLTTQTLAEVGVVPCQVELRKGGERLTSFKFAIEVQETLATDAALESFDETDVLQGLIDEMGEKIPDLAPNRALVSDGAGHVSASDVTSTELGYLDNAKSNIQKQIDDLSAIDNGIKQQIQALETSIGENSGIQEQIEALKKADEAIEEQIEGLAGSGGAGSGEYASKKIYGDTAISLGRIGNIGLNSIAYGGSVIAQGDYSQALGYGCYASGRASHAEGMMVGDKSTYAYGNASHAEGGNTTASGSYSHAEGVGSKTEADATAAHAEGGNTTASGSYSHAEGYSTTASGMRSHAEGVGSKTEADATAAHAEGGNTTASSSYSHAEGYSTTASGLRSHAEGYSTTASGDFSHAEGMGTIASGEASHAAGEYNVDNADNIMMVGCGISSISPQNAMSIQRNGNMKVKGTVTGSTTADYAEFFEWADGNPDGEDRVGLFVTLEGERIRVAKPSDSYILGIVSGAPFVVGNGDCDVWNGMLLRDEFGRIIREEQEVPVMETDPETGEERQAIGEDGEPLTEMEMQEVINPDYDHNQPYVSRFDRKEWSPVGMLGVLRVRQDGTCMADGYCKCGDGGIATACAEGDKGAYRVIAIVSEKVAKAIIR